MHDFRDLMDGYVDVLLGFTALMGGIVVFHRRFIAPTLHKVEALSDLITEQMRENGGGNLVDKVNRIPHIEGKLDALNKRVEKVEFHVLNTEEK
jgi:PBP1b-binding outer membrane lipoprotein LpoB